MLPPSLYAPALAHFLFTMVQHLFDPTLSHPHIRWFRGTAIASLVGIIGLMTYAVLTHPTHTFDGQLSLYYMSLAIVFWMSIGLIGYYRRLHRSVH